MTPKKRKPLDEDGAAFVFGDAPSAGTPPLEAKPTKKSPTTPETTTSKEPSIMEQLLAPAPLKEATVRITIDLEQSLHRKLSILCAKNGRKKADVVRELLREILSNVED